MDVSTTQWLVSTGIMLAGLIAEAAFLSGKFSARLDNQDKEIGNVKDDVKCLKIDVEKKASTAWVTKIEEKADLAQPAEICRDFRKTIIDSTHRIETSVAYIQERLMNGFVKPTGEVKADRT